MKRIFEYDIKLQKKWMACCLIDAYYDLEGAGGTLHVILDDGNYDDQCLNLCLEDAKKYNDYWGITIGNLLLEFTEEEREQIVERYYEIEEQIIE